LNGIRPFHSGHTANCWPTTGKPNAEKAPVLSHPHRPIRPQHFLAETGKYDLLDASPASQVFPHGIDSNIGGRLEREPEYPGADRRERDALAAVFVGELQ
jgi:hypothetical protein